MKLYTKHGSRYREATLAEYVEGLATALISGGYATVATSVVSLIISKLDEQRTSTRDVMQITNEVVDRLRSRS